MVRITMFFAAGVLAGIFAPPLFSTSSCTVLLIIFGSAYFVVRLTTEKFTTIRTASGLIGLFFVLISGYAVVGLRSHANRKEALVSWTRPVLAYQVRLISSADRRENAWRRTGEIVAIQTDEGWKAGDGQLLLYWPLSVRADTLSYGAVLLVLGKPGLIPGPQNPDEFDYRQYLARRNIFHQHHLRGAWMLLEPSPRQGIMFYAQEARKWTIRTIDAFITGERERGIIKAFTIGVTEGIDDELKQAYAAGGAMHALAVSGMHVSILYGVLLVLLRPLERTRGGPWVIAAMSLLLLWMYAFVTGLSPSVLRAVTMFSFVAAAKPLGRTTSIINTLAGSAFFLLLYDPYLILSAGFQLSYMAVLGIVLFYRPIYNLLEPKWAWLDWLWQITCVSIAAQLATLPVTLYYFHQFPVYFLLANLFVIPLSTLILLGGLGLLMLSPFALVDHGLARILEFLVWLLNEGLFLIKTFPSSVIYPVPLSLFQAFCMCAMTMAIYGLFESRQFRWSGIALILASAFSMDSVIRRNEESAEFVVYRVNRHSMMEWVDKSQSFCLVDSALAADKQKISYHTEPHHLAVGIRGVSYVYRSGVKLVDFRTTTFLIIHSRSFDPRASIRCRYVVIGSNAVKSLETLSRSVTFDFVVLDSSNSPAYAMRLREEAVRLGKPCHSVLTDGAFIMSL